TIAGHLEGLPQTMSGSVVLTADALTAGSVRIERVEAKITIADTGKPGGRLDAKFRRAGLDGSVTADAALAPGGMLRVTQLHLAASGTRIDGALGIDLVHGTMEGRLAGTAPELKPWSALVGMPLAGRAQFVASLDRTRGQTIDLSVEGSDLLAGASPPIIAKKLRLTARLADLLAVPSGRAELQLDDVARDRAALKRFRLIGQTDAKGSFALQSEASGQAGEAFTVRTQASANLDKGAIDLRVTSFSGKFGSRAFSLRKSLAITKHGADIAFGDLDFAIEKGSLSGVGSRRGGALSAHLVARDLPVEMLAVLADQPGVSGELGFDVTIAGTRQHPQGDLTLDIEQLRFAAAGRPDLPALGVVASGSWRGDAVEFKGRVAGPRNGALGFAGTVPITLDPDDLAPSIPPRGALSVRLEGEGEIADIADLLPIGEDVLAGHFTVDVNVAGTVADPAASGTLSVHGGHYENVAVGTTLNDVSFDLVGDRDRLALKNFTAGDGAKGTLTLSGALDLANAEGPVFDLNGQLASFRAVQRDEAVATASGDVHLTGKIAAPRLAAELRIDAADLRVPEKLPQNVQPIRATIINSATGEVLSTPDAEAHPPPWLAMSLNVTVTLPEHVFVRGRGLDSEWRGRVTVKGTSAAPQLTGKLDVVRGTFAFIGKTFVLNSGTITFLGETPVDPQIAIEAQVSSTDIVAIVRVTGTATQPKIALASQPALPQDEILARVLFGTSVSQITAAQGFEIAQAAAALANGGDLGILDRIRTGLGLDRLSVGSANTTAALPGLSPGLGVPSLSTTPGVPTGVGGASALGTGTSLLPAGGVSASAPSGVASTAISAGKYVAEGVYVGVTQGLTASTSSVNVQIDVTRHISIDTTAGGTGQGTGIGTGVGVGWKLDY
ncbi:MAG TPA: translocation/assembly module TamB domain-containing protein, partial [Stellaceae bacterium]|nr:translocation/assembly module TamB domain-containing protein [Stellaceae bacterium]